MEQAPLHNEISHAPATGKAHWVTAKDGKRLRIAAWAPAGEPQGTILFFPGRGDYIELYGHVVAKLTENDFATLIIDWRGHGLSDRISANPKLGHINDFSEYQLDVQAMIQAAEQLDLPKPWTVVAHSMGACVALRSMIEGIDVSRVVFSAPMLGIHMATYEKLAVRPITWLMKAIGKGETYTPGFNDSSYVFKNAFDGNTLTNSKEDYEHWKMQGTKVPELHTGGPSMAWLSAAMKETDALAKLPSPDIPCLTFLGENEETVGTHAITSRMNRWPNGTLVSVRDAKHELFLETPSIRESVFKQMIEFLSQPVPAAARRYTGKASARRGFSCFILQRQHDGVVCGTGRNDTPRNFSKADICP